MSFASSLFGGLPGRAAAFRQAASGLAQSIPRQAFSLPAVYTCQRFQSSSAAATATADTDDDNVDPKDLVSVLVMVAHWVTRLLTKKCCMYLSNRHVFASFVTLVFLHTLILARLLVPNVSCSTPVVSRRSMMSVVVMVLAQRWILWIWKEKRVSLSSQLPLMLAGVITILTLLILLVCPIQCLLSSCRLLTYIYIQ